MGAKGKPLTDETKKKISEALRKRFGGSDQESPSAQGTAGQAYLNKFVDKKVEYEDIKAQRDDLLKQAKALGRTKSTAAKRKQIRAQIAEMSKQMAQVRAVLIAIKQEAGGERRKKNASVYLKKAASRVNQYNILITKITDTLANVKDEERRVRLQAQLNRALNGKVALEKRISDAEGIASGKVKEKRSTMFDFEEYLEDRHFELWRDLTDQEKRINFAALNEDFNWIEGTLADQMIEALNQELDRLAKQAEDRLTASDIAWIAGLTLMIRVKTRDSVKQAIQDAYLKGKALAAAEMGIPRPPDTPLFNTQIMKMDAEAIADAYVDNLENTARSSLKAGVAADASVKANVSAMVQKVQEEASKTITNISGTVVGEYLNLGRETVFSSHLTKIVSFERSEMLDMRTCNTCLSLDGRVIKPDDPMAHLKTVHTHCRGLWVPIFATDERKPEIKGVPKSILDTFEMIDGRPITNSFKNMKKPINDVSKEAQKQIKKRIK